MREKSSSLKKYSHPTLVDQTDLFEKEIHKRDKVIVKLLRILKENEERDGEGEIFIWEILSCQDLIGSGLNKDKME